MDTGQTLTYAVSWRTRAQGKRLTELPMILICKECVLLTASKNKNYNLLHGNVSENDGLSSEISIAAVLMNVGTSLSDAYEIFCFGDISSEQESF